MISPKNMLLFSAINFPGAAFSPSCVIADLLESSEKIVVIFIGLLRRVKNVRRF